MSQIATTKSISSRDAALARRKAMSSSGKAALKQAVGNARSSGASASSTSATSSALASANSALSYSGGSARDASLARRKAMSTHGKAAVKSADRVRTDVLQKPRKNVPVAAAALVSSVKARGCGCNATKDECANRDSSLAFASSNNTSMRAPKVAINPAKAASLSRRKALSSKGKAALKASSMSAAQTARASKQDMSSRELGKELREQRSKNGGAVQQKSSPSDKQRSISVGAAQDASWKVGASVTVSGQTVTGTMLGRQENMTGDEPSTCRGITGTEYLGADIFNKFCKRDASASTARKVEVTSTSRGNQISGSRMGRDNNVTGNEHGSCKRVTGNEYTSAEQQREFCSGSSPTKGRMIGSMAQTMKGRNITGNNVGRSENVTGDEYGMRRNLTGTQYVKSENVGRAPEKVGFSTTLRGGGITGTMVGRGERVTGNDIGACRNVTGDDYIGREQFSRFCKSTPNASDSKIAVSQSLAGIQVSGDLAQRSKIVTGDEPGTCQILSGTPYASASQYQEFCSPQQAQAAQARSQVSRRRYGRPMTGQQPGIAGLTGAGRGACDPISGTPYVGSDQVAQVCPSIPAEPGSPDYPQALGSTPWGSFSVSSPIHAAQHDGSFSHVTGSRYESGHITGSFGKAEGKVTGTEQARFDQQPQVVQAMMMSSVPQMVEGRVKSRVTGEGMEGGLRITGDDWDRGDLVTGTEGASAAQRNLTLRGGAMGAMQLRAEMVRPENIPAPVSKVTGGSGNTEKGALITYSGGARG